MANNKNINIVAKGLAGDEKGNVLGYNDTPSGYVAPVIGKSERDSSATYVDKNGVIQLAPPNQLRVDYTNGVAEILLEPQSTNYMPYSEDFTQWTKQETGTSTADLTPNYGEYKGLPTSRFKT